MKETIRVCYWLKKLEIKIKNMQHQIKENIAKEALQETEERD